MLTKPCFFNFDAENLHQNPFSGLYIGGVFHTDLQNIIFLHNFFKERSEQKIKDLTGKEKLFCTYYSLSRNGREAAAKSGYVFPEKSALRLLKRENVIKEIERLDENRKRSEKDISAGYFRLAFGCVSDAVKLLFSDEVDIQKIEEMDFFNISEIKRKKGGDIEIKFFDRLKALQQLYEMTEPSGNNENGFYSAIEKGAAALKGDSFG